MHPKVGYCLCVKPMELSAEREYFDVKMSILVTCHDQETIIWDSGNKNIIAIDNLYVTNSLKMVPGR